MSIKAGIGSGTKEKKEEEEVQLEGWVRNDLENRVNSCEQKGTEGDGHGHYYLVSVLLEQSIHERSRSKERKNQGGLERGRFLYSLQH